MPSWTAAGTQTAGPGASGAVTSPLLNGFRDAIRFLAGDGAGASQRDRATIYDNVGGQNITATAAAVTLAGELVDAAGGHATTVGTTTYTLQTSGMVEVSGCLAVTITGPPAGYVQCYIVRNGTPITASGGRLPTNTTSATGIVSLSTPNVKLAAVSGDTFQLMAVASGTFTTCQTISSGSLCSSLTIELETMT